MELCTFNYIYKKMDAEDVSWYGVHILFSEFDVNILLKKLQLLEILPYLVMTCAYYSAHFIAKLALFFKVCVKLAVT